MTEKTNCIFCRIAQGEITSSKLYEDETSFAILDINPIRPGHTLLIPKKHAASLADISADEQANWLKPLKKLCAAIVEGTGSEGFNLILNDGRCAGQVVPHLHLHIIPRQTNDQVDFNWAPQPYPPDQLKKTFQQISSRL